MTTTTKTESAFKPLTIAPAPVFLDVQQRPLTRAEAVLKMDPHGFLTTTLAIDVATFALMPETDEAFESDSDRYSILAERQMEGGDPYEATYQVLAFDPVSKTIYVEFSTSIVESASSLGYDLEDPEDQVDWINEG